MRFFPEALELPDSTFVILRDLIHDRTGIYYNENKRYMLAERLTPRVIARELESFLDYYYLLKYDSKSQDEWSALMDNLSVPETFFWREFDQIEILSEVLLPQYQEQWPAHRSYQRPLKIWSAACATGEEPLSIAIALQEKGWFHKLPIEIYASDASPQAISKARAGIYREYSFRTLSDQLKNKYFEKTDVGWQISNQIHQHIHWSVANLLCPEEIKFLSKADVIFCRNVFIYFSDTAIKKTAELFFQAMPNPGYLFLSASESLLKLKTKFELVQMQGAFVYVKKS